MERRRRKPSTALSLLVPAGLRASAEALSICFTVTITRDDLAALRRTLGMPRRLMRAPDTVSFTSAADPAVGVSVSYMGTARGRLVGIHVMVEYINGGTAPYLSLPAKKALTAEDILVNQSGNFSAQQWQETVFVPEKSLPVAVRGLPPQLESGAGKLWVTGVTVALGAKPEKPTSQLTVQWQKKGLVAQLTRTPKGVRSLEDLHAQRETPDYQMLALVFAAAAEGQP